MFEPLVEATRGPESEECKYLGNLDAAQLANLLFEAGAAEGVPGKNRQALYDLSAALEKAQRKRMRREEERAAADGEGQPGRTYGQHSTARCARGHACMERSADGGSASMASCAEGWMRAFRNVLCHCHTFMLYDSAPCTPPLWPWRE